MKKLILLTVFLLSACNSHALNLTDFCKNDAKACYVFSEASGVTVVDASGNGNTGTFNSLGHPNWNASVPNFNTEGSAVGSILYSNFGSSEILSIGTSDNIAPYNAAWSFCAWINPTVDTIGGGDPRIFQRGSVLFAIAATKLLYTEVAGSTATDHFSVNNTVTFGSYQNVCATSDGSTTATNYHIYLNGSEVSYSAAQSGVTPTSNSGQTAYLGNNSAGTRSCACNLAQPAFWSRQITAAEVATQYNYGLAPILRHEIQ